MERLKTSNVSIGNNNIKFSNGKSMFVVYLQFKSSRATVANSDIGRVKPLHTLFDKYLYHILVKFEQNRMVRYKPYSELFDAKL